VTESLEKRVERLESLLACATVYDDTISIPREKAWEREVRRLQKWQAARKWSEGLSSRARNLLAKRGFTCLGDLRTFMESGALLGNFNGFGDGVVKEITEWYHKRSPCGRRRTS